MKSSTVGCLPNHPNLISQYTGLKFSIFYQEKLKIGEPSSAATKVDRQINESDHRDEEKNIMGRKIDILFVGDLKDVGKLELASVETKPANATKDVQRIDLNKNIKTTKSIYSNLQLLVNGSDDIAGNIGMMIVGKYNL